MIVHGIPSEDGRPRRGRHHLASTAGRSSRATTATPPTPPPVGEVSAEATRLMEVTEASLYAGIDQLTPGNRLHEVGRAVQQVAEAAGFSVVREYVGPRHRHGHARGAPGARTTGRARRDPPSRRGWSSPSSPWSTPGDRHGPARRRLERGHRRRPAVGPLRAHHRRDRRRARRSSPSCRPLTRAVPGPRRTCAGRGRRTGNLAHEGLDWSFGWPRLCGGVPIPLQVVCSGMPPTAVASGRRIPWSAAHVVPRADDGQIEE